MGTSPCHRARWRAGHSHRSLSRHGRGQQLRSRVFVFVLAAFLATYATGTVMLVLLEELGATATTSRSASTAIELVLGVLLIALAVRLQRKRPDPDADMEVPSGRSKIDRYLESRRLAFVLGITLYIIPSPIYIGAIKAIADAKLSTSSELLDLAVTVAVMLWLVGIPMLLLLTIPGHAERALDEPTDGSPQRADGRDCRIRRGRRLPRDQGPRRPGQLRTDAAASPALATQLLLGPDIDLPRRSSAGHSRSL